ncbi:MAG: invasion associated locus B family protein [Gemmobacter sp.]
MSHIRSVLAAPLAAVAALSLALDAFAQTPAPAPRPASEAQTDVPALPPTAATDLSLGEVVDDESPAGTNYVAAEFGDWQQTCFKTELEADPCELYQLLKDQSGNTVAEISLFGLPPGTPGGAVAGSSIITPLETFLPAQVTIRVDSGQAKRYPFTFCAALGCVARVGFTAEEIAAFRRGSKATMIIVPALAPDQQVVIDISLRGFTAGFEAVNKANAAADAAAKAAAAAAAPTAP